MSTFSETAAAAAMSLKGLPQRLTGSLVAVVGVATTVAVMISLLALGAGLLKTSGKNIAPDRVIVTPRGVQSEYAGNLSRDDVSVIAQAPGIRTAGGRPMAQPVALVVVEVTKKKGGVTTNIPIRGTGDMGWKIDRTLKLTGGRMYRPGVHELIVGKHVREQFKGFEIGDRVTLRGVEWRVVGVLGADGGMAENAIMADADTVMAAFDRTGYQSVEVALTNPAAFRGLRDALTTNPQLDVEPRFYSDYVRGQMKQVTALLDFVGYFVGAVMSVGAVIGAINTMYSAVDGRTREFATLRAIGFGGTAVVVSVVLESLMLAIPGALLGAAIAWAAFNGHAVTTAGLTFPLAVTWPLAITGMAFAVAIGLIGGIAPALKAMGIPVAAALRAI